MADIRPKDLLPTAERPADDDYLLLDGETQGTRKLSAAGMPISVKHYGAKGDGQIAEMVSMTAGSTTVTRAGGAEFDADCVGRSIWIGNAGPGGATLATTIVSRTNGNAVVVANAASGTVSGSRAVYGTNDTAAIQAVHAAHLVVHYPLGVYIIDEPIVLQTRRQSAYGVNSVFSQILQVTNNAQIFIIDAQFFDKSFFNRLNLTWLVGQASTATNSIAFQVGTNGVQRIMYHCEFKDLRFEYGLRGFDIHPGGAVGSCFWGNTFDQLFFALTWRGSAIRHAPTIPAGAPNNNFINVYVRADAIHASETIFHFVGGRQAKVGVFEVNHNNQGCRVMRWESSEATIDVLSDEAANYTQLDGADRAILSYTGSYIRVGLMMSQLSTFNPSTGTGNARYYLTRHRFGSSATCILDCVKVLGGTKSTGELWVARPEGAASRVSVGYVEGSILNGVVRSDDTPEKLAFHEGALVRKWPRLAAAPSGVEMPLAGMVVFADGVNWNPGSGSGLYVYDNNAWHYLGGAGMR